MKRKLFPLLVIFTITLFFIINCSNNHKTKLTNNFDLEDSNKLYSLSRTTDSIEHIYNKILKSNTELQELEKSIETSRNNKANLLSSWDKFDEKNTVYYSDAKKRISTIKDEALKERIISLINKSSLNYSNKSNNIKLLTNNILKNKIEINDLHIALKIIFTISFIENYQNLNIPESKNFSDFIIEQNKLKETLKNKTK